MLNLVLGVVLTFGAHALGVYISTKADTEQQFPSDGVVIEENDDYDSLNQIVVHTIKTKHGREAAGALLRKNPEAGWPELAPVLPPEDRDRLKQALTNEFVDHLGRAPSEVSLNQSGTTRKEDLASALSRALDAVAKSRPGQRDNT